MNHLEKMLMFHFVDFHSIWRDPETTPSKTCEKKRKKISNKRWQTTLLAGSAMLVDRDLVFNTFVYIYYLLFIIFPLIYSVGGGHYSSGTWWRTAK
jgi:hypothetical protein